MAVGDWDPQAVTDIINEFKDSTAQAKKNEAPIVSTFEGPDWSVNWPGVRDSVGGIFLMPDWSSLGPERLGNEKMDVIDGACKSITACLLVLRANSSSLLAGLAQRGRVPEDVV